MPERNERNEYKNEKNIFDEAFHPRKRDMPNEQIPLSEEESTCTVEKQRSFKCGSVLFFTLSESSGNSGANCRPSIHCGGTA